MSMKPVMPAVPAGFASEFRVFDGVGVNLRVSSIHTARIAMLYQLADDPSYLWHVSLFIDQAGPGSWGGGPEHLVPIRAMGLPPCKAIELAVTWVRYGLAPYASPRHAA